MLRDEALTNNSLKSCNIIDAHAHIGPLAAYYNPETTLEEIIRLMDKTGIRVICATGMDCLNNNVVEGNERIFRAIQEFPDRILGYCTVNPWNIAEMESELKKYKCCPGFIGIKIHPSDHNYPVTGENYKLVWECAQEYNLVVLSHTWADGPTCPPESFAGVLEKYPDMKLLLGHSGGLYYGYEQCYRLVREFPNVYMELCGCEGSRTWLATVLDRVPYGKVVFGTDQVFHDPRYLLGRVIFADISEEAKTAILSGNMKRILISLERCSDIINYKNA